MPSSPAPETFTIRYQVPRGTLLRIWWKRGMLRPRILVGMALALPIVALSFLARDVLAYLGLGFAAFVVVFPIHFYRTLARSVDKNHQWTDPKTLEVSAAGMVVRGPDWRGEHAWSAFHGLSEDAQYFYLQRGANVVVTVLPKSAFTPELIDKFRRWATAHHASNPYYSGPPPRSATPRLLSLGLGASPVAGRASPAPGALTISYALSREVLVRAMWRRRMLRPAMLALMVGLGIAVVAWLLAPGVYGYLGIALIVLLAPIPLGLRRALAKAVDDNPQWTGPRTLEISDAGVVQSGPDWRSELPWSDFQSVSEDASYWYLMDVSDGVLPVSKHGLSEPARTAILSQIAGHLRR